MHLVQTIVQGNNVYSSPEYPSITTVHTAVLIDKLLRTSSVYISFPENPSCQTSIPGLSPQNDSQPPAIASTHLAG